MNQTTFREQLLRQEGLAGGFVPAKVQRAIRKERRKAKFKRGLTLSAMVVCFLGAIICLRLPETPGIQNNLLRRHSAVRTYMYHPQVSAASYHYGALALGGLGLLIFAGTVLRQWRRRRRLASIETSLGDPFQALREARGGKSTQL